MGILGAGALAAIGGIGSALIGSSSASDASNAQIQATNSANQTELSMYNSTVGREAPFVAGGTAAFNQLLTEMGITPQAAPAANYTNYPSNYPGAGYGRSIASTIAAGGPMIGISDPGIGGRVSTPTAGTPAATGTTPAAPNASFGSLVAPFTQAQFEASPGYQYQLQQGNAAIANSAAARGGLVSGNALKALQANGIGLANQDWYNAQNAYYQQQQQRFNMLQTLAGSGQNAAANLGALGSNVAGSIGANTIGAGNSAAAASVAQGQVWSNLLNNQSFLSGINSMFGGGGGGFNPASAMDFSGLSLPSVDFNTVPFNGFG